LGYNILINIKQLQAMCFKLNADVNLQVLIENL